MKKEKEAYKVSPERGHPQLFLVFYSGSQLLCMLPKETSTRPQIPLRFHIFIFVTDGVVTSNPDSRGGRASVHFPNYGVRGSAHSCSFYTNHGLQILIDF